MSRCRCNGEAFAHEDGVNDLESTQPDRATEKALEWDRPAFRVKNADHKS